MMRDVTRKGGREARSPRPRPAFPRRIYFAIPRFHWSVQSATFTFV